jgi:hypothetical protein
VILAAEEKNSRALCPGDAATFVLSLLEDMESSYYWLLLVWTTRKLPAEGRPNLSARKSNEKRHEFLHRIHSSRRLGNELIDELEALLPSNELARRAFYSVRVRMLCIEISATRHAVFSASQKTPLSRNEVEAMMASLDAIRERPDFVAMSPGDRDLFWATAAIVYDELGDDRGRAVAMKERRALVGDDPDALLQLLIHTLDDAAGDDEKVALLRDLVQLPQSFDAGPLFSHARVGRASMLGDSLWGAATSIGAEAPLAGVAIDESIVAYRAWTFGDATALGSNAIRLVCDWTAGGNGRLRWDDDDGYQIREFQLDHELVERFFFDREAMRPFDRGAAPELARFLDEDLGPLLAEATKADKEVRLHASGAASVLPLLAAVVDLIPLGASDSIAYAHPNPTVAGRSPRLGPFELLVVDDCFGPDSAKVSSAVRIASPTSRILRFDSEEGGTELSREVLKEALQSVSSALLFCHVDTPALYGAEAAILTGPEGRLRMEEIADLELRSLDELALIGCASGRPNLFLGQVTVAHAAAVAGAQRVLGSLWPIRPRDGAEFASELAKAIEDQGMAAFLAHRYRSDPKLAASFSLIRP